MTSEYVIYKAPMSNTNNTLTIEKSLEVMKWILDPDSKPYESNDKQKIIARSAGQQNEAAQPSKSTIQKQLELQRLILQD